MSAQLLARDAERVAEFAASLRRDGYTRISVDCYVTAARGFLRWLGQRRIVLEDAPGDIVDRYLTALDRRAVATAHRRPHRISQRGTAVRALLRTVFGAWPRDDVPEMAHVRAYLRERGYASDTVSTYLPIARRFVLFLRARALSLETADPGDQSLIDDFVRDERRQQLRRGVYSRFWAPTRRRVARVCFRLAPPRAPRDERSVLLAAFATWLLSERHLAPSSAASYAQTIRYLLDWIGLKAVADLGALRIEDVDGFYMGLKGQSRGSRGRIAAHLRAFLKYLYGRGVISRPLGDLVDGPRQYADERLPSAFPPETVATILAAARRDRTSIGRRDYAILILLSLYGLRACEVAAIRLEDIDWDHMTLLVRRSKNRMEARLPLLAPAATAIAAHARSSRDSFSDGFLFHRSLAPLRPASAYLVQGVLKRRLSRMDLSFTGRHGTHAFRHAAAVGMLRSGERVGRISRVLGHMHAQSTRVYLKLAEDDLRAVALEVPE